MKRCRLFSFLWVAILFVSCNNSIRSGADLSAEEIDLIRGLGLLDSSETILSLHTQSGRFRRPVLQAGNFITDERIACYWIGRDTSENVIHSAYYTSIDTMTPHFNNPWPAGNYIKVDTAGRNWFNVYVSSDTAHARSFYEAALDNWRARRKK